MGFLPIHFSGWFAEPVEQQKKENGNHRVDQRADCQMRIEPPLGLREQRGDDNRTATKLVHLNVRFAQAQIKSVVHRLAAGEAWGAPGAEDCASVFAPSFLISKGCSDRRTITSSSRSRFAAGLIRICLNGLPGFISTIVPIGRSRGKMRSMPLVLTRSPGLTVSSFGTYFMVSSGSPCPPTGL